MNRKLVVLSAVLLGVIASLVVGGAVAENIKTTTLAPMANVGSSFSYQGYLEDDGVPVNNTCDFIFSLWEGGFFGNQVGSDEAVDDVVVVNGYFTVLLNDTGSFGPEAFIGQERWLEISVGCPAGTGFYVTLSPRQELLATPFAHTLRPGAVISGTMGRGEPVLRLNSNETGLRVTSELIGIRVQSTGGTGIFVESVAGNGLSIGSANLDGVRVASAGGDGLYVGTADQGLHVYSVTGDGVQIDSAGVNGLQVNSAGENGLQVNSANNGLYVETADTAGVHVDSTDFYGLLVSSAGYHGVWVENATYDGMHVSFAGANGYEVHSANYDGLYVEGAGDDGIDVGGDSLAGYFRGNIQVTGNCTGCLLATFGVNSGSSALEPGDIVALKSITSSPVEAVPALWQVAAAVPGEVLVGVVQGQAELVTVPNPRPGENPQRLIPRQGTAEPGDYLTIIIYGPVQVQVNNIDSLITSGSRLTVDAMGQVRPLQTVEVNGVVLAESVPSIGVALESTAVNGLIWVLVNPH